MSASTGNTGFGGRRGLLIGIAVAAAVIVIGVLVALSATGGDGDSGDDGPLTVAGVVEVQRELQGVEKEGTFIGPSSAPVTVTEYGDLQCPFCAQAAATTVPELVASFVAVGQVRLQLRTLAFIGDDSRRGALAVHAAARQDLAWDLTEVLYRNQGGENDGWLSDELITKAAEEIGFDMAAFEEDRASDQVAADLAADEEAARESGVQSTPTFVVTGPGGTEVVTGPQDVREVAAAIAKVAP